MTADSSAEIRRSRRELGFRALDWILLASVLALSTLVRLAALRPDVLHEDEALFSSFGLRVADHFDLLLLHGGFPLDRPPLFFWILGTTMAGLGNTPITIRIPNLVFAGITVVAVYVLVRQLGGGRAGGLIAAVAMALSPYAIAFGPSVFEEPGAVALGTVALVLAVANRPIPAGLVLGAAVCIKLTAAAYFPLALVLLLLIPGDRVRRGVRFSAGFAAPVALLFGLMLMRTLVFDAGFFLSLQYQHIGGTGLVPPAEWPDRAKQWLFWIGFFFVGPIVVFWAIGLALSVSASVSRRTWEPLALIAFTVGYFILIVIFRSPVYDRYAFYLLPPAIAAAAIGWGWGIQRLVERRGWRLAPVAAVLMTLVLLWPTASTAFRGGYPVAGIGQRTYDGYQQICAWVRAHGSSSDIVWNQSLNWHFAYCLADAPIRSYWYPDAAAIATRGAGRFLALTELDEREVVEQLRQQGWCVTLAQEFFASDGLANMWTYDLSPPGAGSDCPT